jgi:alpha-ketoglutarate-dependent 2,4-dichlorophenoxyacetate dioxygenase
MSFDIRPVSAGFAAEIYGFGTADGITAEKHALLEDALAKYGVLVLRGEQVDDDIQEALIRNFGPPLVTDLKGLAEGKQKHPHFYDLSTVDDEGKPIDENSFVGLYQKANLLWHTDGTQVQPPIRVTILSARVLPSAPPTTEYADMRAAWDALPETRKRELEGLQVEHSIYASRAKVGLTDFDEEVRKTRPPVAHPLVRVHPRTGRKSLYLASHASHVIGWPKAEGEALLAELTEFATQRQFVYVHQWRDSDIVIWDDSFTMHRAMPYSGAEPRKMRWCAARELAPV